MAEQAQVHGRLGARLRELRGERRLTVRALAARSGFSPSFISNVELEVVSPSIGSLEKIAGALGVTLSQLFSSLEASPRVIVRRSERTLYKSAWSRSTAAVLADAASNRKLSAVEVTIESGGTSGTQTVSSQDTFALVLAGALSLTVDQETNDLAAGDSAYLHKGMTFSWRNDTMETASLLLVGIADQIDIVRDVLTDESVSTIPSS
jgi:XRE family transcriptional regulator, regulator of sulfur utilization